MTTTVHGIDLPYIPNDLLTALDIRFPDTCPSLKDEERMVWFKAGQRSVVTYLADQSRRQKEADGMTAITHEVGESVLMALGRIS